MNILIVLLKTVEVILFVYLGLAAVYIFIFSILGLFSRNKKQIENPRLRKIAVLIPGYKEDSVIIGVAESALMQDYPKHLFDVVIIADTFQAETLQGLGQLPVKLVEVSFEKSTKSKALNAAMAAIGDDYEIAVVLDADNIMSSGFLWKINQSFERGYLAVQGHRTSKNTNTSMALLDSVSEEINNHIFRKGHRVAGLSSALIGSAMAFQYDLFKTKMAEIRSIAGEDKELELRLVGSRITVDYLDDAVVLDEKVQKMSVFQNQRKRWLAAQLQNFRDFAKEGFLQFVTRLNFGYLDKLYQMVQPPRILLAGFLFLLTGIIGIISLFSADWADANLVFGFYPWLTILTMTILALVFAVPGRFYTLQTLKAILTLPKGFLTMFLLLFRLKGADKTFIHTPHGVQDVNSEDIVHANQTNNENSN